MHRISGKNKYSCPKGQLWIRPWCKVAFTRLMISKGRPRRAGYLACKGIKSIVYKMAIRSRCIVLWYLIPWSRAAVVQLIGRARKLPKGKGKIGKDHDRKGIEREEAHTGSGDTHGAIEVPT